MKIQIQAHNATALADAEKQPQNLVISHLQRREIQAPIAACLIRGFMDAVGEAKALEVASAAIAEDARKSGQVLAEELGANDLKALLRIVNEVWAEEGAIVIELLEGSDQNLSFNVTRCRYAETYEAQGFKDLGYCLSCSRDGAFASGFNPRIQLTRTQTLMEGAPHCDFRFKLA